MFKTKSEKRAFKMGMQAQFCKEHPRTDYHVVATHYYFNKDGSYQTKPYSTLQYSCKTKKEAMKAINDYNEKSRRKINFLKKNGINENDSDLHSVELYSCTKEPFRKGAGFTKKNMNSSELVKRVKVRDLSKFFKK